MHLRQVIAASFVTGALALGASPCAAKGRATNQFRVSVNPIASCTVGATPLVFFVPVPANADFDNTATITVKCPPNTAYVVDIDNGLNPQGINRRVFNAVANAYLTYDVYKDPPRSQVWGKGSLKNVSGNSGVTGLFVYTVYGRLNAKASMKAGGYRDTLTITVTF